MDLFVLKNPPNSTRTNEIKVQVAAELGLAEDTIVMVTELTCMEEGCPPIETVIAVFTSSGNKFQFKLHQPIAEITAEDIHRICKQRIDSSLEIHHGSNCS